MSKVQLYKGVKQALKDMCNVKHVGLFNNQFMREKEENAFLYPCVFIEFKPSQYRNYPNRIQDYELTLTLHIGWESYVDDDLDILEFIESIYVAVHGLQIENFGLLLRKEERQNFDHDNVQVYEMDFGTLGKDYAADTRAKRKVMVTPQITGELVKPNEL